MQRPSFAELDALGGPTSSDSEDGEETVLPVVCSAGDASPTRTPPRVGNFATAGDALNARLLAGLRGTRADCATATAEDNAAAALISERDAVRARTARAARRGAAR